MKNKIRLAIAQINCTVGDIDGNVRKIGEYITKARALKADVVSFPELSVAGYPPEDLLLKKQFIDDNLKALKAVSAFVGDIVVVAGFIDRVSRDIYNAAAVIYKGRIRGVYHKMFLPNYGVFDEKRYFKPGKKAVVFRLGSMVFGVNICEDIWHSEGPIKAQADMGANFIININSSPYYKGKIGMRERIIRDSAKKNRLVISYANMVGGQDELVFDGESMVVGPSGDILAKADTFKEDLLLADVDIKSFTRGKSARPIVITEDFKPKEKPALPRRHINRLAPVAEIYEALKLGLKDYVAKNGFKKVVMGLSGGIDSSLVAAIAADALGAENAVGVYLPTHYSSQRSEDDAKELAANLGMKLKIISIEQIFKHYLITLAPHFTGTAKDITEENLQARIRGNIIMAFSNKFGWLVLTTGNKSEMSTGYATLYGDMAGGFAVIKDVPKTLVYKLAKYRNSVSPVISESILAREPTAELRQGQRDRDTLPPYAMLDGILKAYIEEDKALPQIVSLGFKKDISKRVINMVDKSEYKRRQSPPGIKITPKALGRDRRMPITNRYGI